MILLLCVLIVLAVATVYFLIPATLTVAETIPIKCVSNAAFRNLSVAQSWGNWWPGADTGVIAGNSFYLSNSRYSLSKKADNNLEILIEDQKDTVKTAMNLLSIAKDSTLVNWHFNISAGNNPFSRIAAYRRALSLKKNMNILLHHIQNYLSDFKNVYGFPLVEGSTTDTTLLTTKTISATWPGTDLIYALIDKLKKTCSEQGCTITGTPMLNVSPLYNAGYLVRVALPVNRMMASKDSITGMRMVPGKFIIAEAVGGLQTVAGVHQQLSFYFQDFGRVSMAIPFDYLVTDRKTETDTSKWVTRIYAPVY